MAKTQKTRRLCAKGHTYYKSSDCSSCPKCELIKKPKSGFLSNLAAPARRALEQNKITTLKKLASYSEVEILKIHGIGKTCLKALRHALSETGLKFKIDASFKKIRKITEPQSVLKLTAKQFVEDLKVIQTIAKSDNSKFYKGLLSRNKLVGVQMNRIFSLAKDYQNVPLNEIKKLLDSDYYEVRMGAVSIMDFQARNKKISTLHKKALYELYLSKHDRIDNWDLVDRSAPYVIGGYLFDKQRTPLYKLAKSKQEQERRTAIVATYYFIRQNDLSDTFKIAELLVYDTHESIHKAVGSWIREAGKRDPKQLHKFLDTYAATMPRVSLRYAVEKMNPKLKTHYMSLKK